MSFLIRINKQNIPTIIYKLLEVSIVPFLYIFLFGMMIYCFHDKFLPFFWKTKYIFIGLYIAWSLLPSEITGVFQGVRYNLVTTLLLMCALFSIGYGFGRHRLKTDYSYAFYLWHMVVVNFIHHNFIHDLNVNLEMLGWMIFEIFIIGVIAWGSVQLIDKRLNPILQKQAFQLFKIH